MILRGAKLGVELVTSGWWNDLWGSKGVGVSEGR